MRNQKGQALIETAIILPLLLLLIFALCDYARAMYTQNTLNNAARAAARAAAVTPDLTAQDEIPLPTATTPPALVVKQNIFNGIDPNEVKYELRILDATTGAVVTGAAARGNLVQVRVTWPTFKMVTPIYSIMALVTGSTVEDQSTKALRGEASMRYE